MCAQTAVDDPGTPTPPGPPRRGTQITPIQWVGLAALLGLIAYQSGALNAPGGLNAYLEEVGPRLIALLIAITIHEFSHGLVATWFGDSTPRRAGRLTLNPLKHLDPIGTILILVRAPIGWGRPMPINPGEMRNTNLGWALSSLAGPISNILLAAIVIFALRFVAPAAGDTNTLAFTVVLAVIEVNIFLAVFNLLPIPPLDGFGVVFGLSPRPIKVALLPLLRYGPLILLLVLFLPQTQQFLGIYLDTGARLILRALGGLSRGL